MASPLIEVKNLTKNYHGRRLNVFSQNRDVLTAVNNVDLTFFKGEVMGLVGESGCGKSTLGKSILQLIKPTSGNVLFDNTELTGLNDELLRKKRADMQYIFQDPQNCLNAVKTVRWILEEPLLAHGIRDKDKRMSLVMNMLDMAGMSGAYLNRRPRELSGGQAQRIAILSALILKPRFVVADEPVSALDVSIQAQILNFINELKASMNLTILFITHDLSVCHYMSDRIGVMYLGSIVEIGDADTVYTNPLHPYTKMLFSSVMNIKTEHRKVYRQNSNNTNGTELDQKAHHKGCPYNSLCRYKMQVCKEIFPGLYNVDGRKVRCLLYKK